MMILEKRALVIGAYNTAAHGFTLHELFLTDPEQKTNYADRIGGDGSHDLSTTMTDGIPRYKNRTLTATLELSRGSREAREAVLGDMVNTLDGFVWPITHPDKPGHYLTGRVHVAVKQNTRAYAVVSITAVVEPWFYAKQLSTRTLTAVPNEEHSVQLRNAGRLAVVPTLTVAGEVTLTYNGVSITLGAGEAQWPSLLLTCGVHTLSYIGNGPLTISFREGVLR